MYIYLLFLDNINIYIYVYIEYIMYMWAHMYLFFIYLFTYIYIYTYIIIIFESKWCCRVRDLPFTLSVWILPSSHVHNHLRAPETRVRDRPFGEW